MEKYKGYNVPAGITKDNLVYGIIHRAGCEVPDSKCADGCDTCLLEDINVLLQYGVEHNFLTKAEALKYSLNTD